MPIDAPGQPDETRRPVIASDRVRFVGDIVAAVVAESAVAAADAADLVWVDYDELPSTSDPREAMAEGAPLLFPELGTNLIYEKGTDADPHVLDGAGLSHAIGVVVTLNDVHQVERVVSTVLNFYPAVPVYARARDFKTENALLVKGVKRAVPEAAESSVQLGKAVLQGIGVADSDLVTILEDFRRDDYALIRPARDA